MIRMPQRSVTRFFIPLVDVMMLLFSMFLLMPFMEGGSAKSEVNPEELTRVELVNQAEQLQTELKKASEQVRTLKKERDYYRQYADPQITKEKLMKQIEELKKAKIDVLQKRLFLQVVVFDPKREDLVFFDKAPNPVTKIISKEEDANELIKKHQEQAKADGLDLFYVMLVPPRGPTQTQLSTYKEWFQNVPYQILVTPQ